MGSAVVDMVSANTISTEEVPADDEEEEGDEEDELQPSTRQGERGGEGLLINSQTRPLHANEGNPPRHPPR